MLRAGTGVDVDRDGAADLGVCTGNGVNGVTEVGDQG